MGMAESSNSAGMENGGSFDYPAMTDAMFAQFSAFIQAELGIKMPRVKKTMLQARLQRRMRQLGVAGYKEYYEYVFSPKGKDVELIHMIDAVTTNKTQFFRESQHFDYLTGQALPDLISNHGVGIQRPCLIWSAGCSTGEEPYTLAMVLSEFAETRPGFSFRILATDISTRVLQNGIDAIYSHDRADPVSMPMRKKYLLKSKDPKKNLIRIVPRLRERVRFQRLNFMDEDLGLRETMDVVFCRNVLIYFNRENQERVLNRLCRHLRSGGYLFTGHSETLNGLRVPVNQVAPNVYRRDKAQ